MKTLGEFKEDVPDWALSYIHNGDASGLEDGEQKMVDEWMAYYQAKAEAVGGHLIFSSVNDEDGDPVTNEFNSNPAFGLACGTETTLISILGDDDDEDPTPYCAICRAKKAADCHCPPTAENE